MTIGRVLLKWGCTSLGARIGPSAATSAEFRFEAFFEAYSIHASRLGKRYEIGMVRASKLTSANAAESFNILDAIRREEGPTRLLWAPRHPLELERAHLRLRPACEWASPVINTKAHLEFVIVHSSLHCLCHVQGLARLAVIFGWPACSCRRARLLFCSCIIQFIWRGEERAYWAIQMLILCDQPRVLQMPTEFPVEPGEPCEEQKS